MISRSLKFALLAMPFVLTSACGDSTVDDTAPEAPIVSPDVPSVVIKCETDGCTDRVTIFGIKQASVAVVEANLGEVQGLDETTEFSFEVDLAEGMNRFELRAQDNAGNKSKKTPVEILLAMRPEPVTITQPEVSDVFTFSEASINWGGTKPAGTGVHMVQQVDGTVVVDALLVAPDAATTWSARANLQTTEDPARNVNNFTFFAVTAQSVRSAPISREVDYDDVGCQLTIANRTYDNEGNIRQNRPLEYSEKSCVRTVGDEELPGLCVWTSLVGGAEDDRHSLYPMIGVACENSQVKGTIDGGSELEFREAIDEVQWSQDIMSECSTCEAGDAAEGMKHVQVWAVLGERMTRKRNVWVVTDFTSPTFADIVYKDEDGNAIEDDATSTAGATVEVCGTTEAYAEVTLENTDTGGVVQAQAQGSADADGAFCLTVDLAEGDNNLYLSAIDMARNVSAQDDNPARLLNVDNTGPNVTWITPRANSWVNTGTSSVVVEANDAYNGVDTVRVGIGEGEGTVLEPSGDDDGRYVGTIDIPAEGARIEMWASATDGLGTETRSEIAVFRSGEPLIISNEQDGWNSQVPRLAVGTNGEVFATWETCVGLNACEMELVAASHLGQDGTWGDPVILNVRNSANGSTPDVAVDENGLAHFVWTDSGRVGGRDGSSNIVYTTWDGTAPTITEDTCDNAGAVQQPQNPETPVVCWAGFMQSQGGMGDVGSITSQGISGGDATYARIGAGPLGPAAVFVIDTLSENTGRAYEVYLATSQEGAWTPQLISDNTAGGEDGADKPDLSIDGSGAAHIVWEDDGDRDGDAENDVDILYVNTGVGADSLLVNGNCGQSGNLDEDGFPIRETSSPVIAVDAQDANNRAYVAWLAEGGCGVGQNTAVRWAYTEQGAPFTSGTDGSGAFLASAGDEFATAANRRPDIAVHSVEGDMTTQTLAIVWQTDAPTRGAGGDKDIVLRRYSRNYDGTGDQPAVTVITESVDGEDNDQQDDYKPSAAVDPGGAIHAMWEKRANREDDKDVYYGVSAP